MGEISFGGLVGRKSDDTLWSSLWAGGGVWAKSV